MRSELVTPSTIDETRTQLRRQMPVAVKWAYLDHAAVAPLPEPTANAIASWLTQASREGDTVWPEWARQTERTRRTAADLLGADPTEIALIPNTTTGINFVAEGIDWRQGDNVVTLDDEFPSNLYPWMVQADRGVELRLTPTSEGRVDLDQLDALCDHRTRVVSVSWVGYRNGCRRDLVAIGEIARRHNALLFVDAIQGVGAFPLKVNDARIDFLAADGHKWQLGPEGAGIAYIRKDRLDALRPVGVGWNSVKHAGDFANTDLTLKSDASRYEGGSLNMSGLIGLGASLELLASLDIGRVAEAILDWTDRACERLTARGARLFSPREGDQRSGIISFDVPNLDPQQVRRQCLEAGVALACRGGALRVSAHAYNDQDDLDRLIESIFS